MKKNWNRLLAVLMALLIGLGSVDGALTSVLAYAEPMDALTTAVPADFIDGASKASQTADATWISEKEETYSPPESPYASTAPETTDVPEPVENPDVTEAPEVSQKPDDRTETERAIQENGYAYVRTKDAPVDVFSDGDLTSKSRIGVLTEAGSLLYAEKYIDRGEKVAALLVRFDAEDGTVQGYIRFDRAEDKPLALDDAQKLWKNVEIRTWMDSEKTMALPLAAFEALSDEPTVAATDEPTIAATDEPTIAATEEPTVAATDEPTVAATEEPIIEETFEAERSALVCVDAANLRTPRAR